MAANSKRHFHAVEDGPHYATKELLPPKRFAQVRKQIANQRKKAAEIIEKFKAAFCEPDEFNGGWMCLDVMMDLSVDDMRRMLRRRRF